MATPTSSSSAVPSPAPDPPPSSSSSAPAQPLPRPFAPPPLRPAPPAPIFPSQPLLGKPLNPPPPPPPQGFLFHHRAFPPRPASRPPVDQPLAVPVPVPAPAGYIRSPAPPAVMTFAAVTQARPYVYGPSDQMVASLHVPIHHVRPPPPQPAATLVPTRPGVVAAIPSAPAALKGAPLASQPKVGSLSSSLENKRERDRCKEDDVMMIYGRKVRVLEGYSPSLYSLCRSWVRNGQPHEIQSHYGDAEKLLPRPLPASMIESQVTKQQENDTETEDAKEEEPACSVEELSLDDLLQRHVKHAKSVRARLRKERLLRIERCKQRLALLLPPPGELSRNETAP